MNLLQQVFVVVPVVALLLVLAGYVFRSGFGRKARLALTLVFVFCCSRYYVGLWFFGSVFYPEFPEWLHWSWCWAYVVTVILAGMAAKNPGTVGQGILAGSKKSMVSSFSHVRSIEIFRRRNVIKVNERFNKNQVYAYDEDFDFVVDFIKSHVTKKCKIYEK